MYAIFLMNSQKAQIMIENHNNNTKTLSNAQGSKTII